jgi:peptidyl-prolyl cis-trans isomerase A (cyclophilin A)
MRNRFPLVFSALGAALLVAAGPARAQQSSQTQGSQTQDLPDAPQATAAATTVPNGPSVVMDTSMGRITCQFFQKQAPKAVANFIALAEGTKDWTDPATKKVVHHRRLYDGTQFHRVIPEFMIQGGDPLADGTGDPGYTFDDEFDPDLSFDRPGRLAMANSGPNTNGSQFFITEQAYPALDMHYTLFGQCDDASVEVVKTIARVQRDGNDKPLTPVFLNEVTIVPEGAPIPAQPGAAAPPKQIAISAGVAVGLLESHTPPVYPPDAKRAGISGTVVLQAVIGTDGLMKQLTVISGPPPLQQAALDAVKTWRYRPYLLNGQPVEVRTTINVMFTLANGL